MEWRLCYGRYCQGAKFPSAMSQTNGCIPSTRRGATSQAPAVIAPKYVSNTIPNVDVQRIDLEVTAGSLVSPENLFKSTFAPKCCGQRPCILEDCTSSIDALRVQTSSSNLCEYHRVVAFSRLPIRPSAHPPADLCYVTLLWAPFPKGFLRHYIHFGRHYVDFVPTTTIPLSGTADST